MVTCHVTHQSRAAAMARVKLVIDDPANFIALKAMLEAEGHYIAAEDAHVAIFDDPADAEREASPIPTLVVSAASGLPRIMESMKRGVYGYLLLPLLPGEAGMMVHRALNRASAELPTGETVPRTLEEAEEEHIRAVLRQCKHNRSKAARVLGIGRNTLWRKLKKMEAQEQARPKSGMDTPL